jgi:hypothetical protein
MSRTEHDSWKEADCLCGQGQITRHVVSTDYRFGGATVSFELDCAICARQWRLDGTTLVEIETDRIARSAWNAVMAAYREHSLLAAELVDGHIARSALKTKKAELAELNRLGFNAGNYASYTARRREGQSPGEVAAVPRGAAGLLEIAGQKADQVRAVLQRVGRAEAEHGALARQVKRHSLGVR